jgi:hypothetical protein
MGRAILGDRDIRRVLGQAVDSSVDIAGVGQKEKKTL